MRGAPILWIMSWSRALKESARTGLRIERARLEPLPALRAAAGVAIVIGLALWLASPTVAASSAFGAFASGSATFQRSWRSRPVLALAAGAALSVSTFLGYLAGAHWALFLALVTVWAFLAGMAWTLGPTSGIVAALTVGIMLVTVTLPTSVLGALEHAAVIAFGGLVQAVLIVLFPIRRWGRHRDALADAYGALADHARRLRNDPVTAFDPQPLMNARSAATMTPRQARRRPAELGGPRGLAERIRPVLASLADPSVGVPAQGPERDRVRELLGAAASVLDAVARAVRNAGPVQVPEEVEEALREPDAGLESGAARRTATRLVALLGEAVESAAGRGHSGDPGGGHLLRPTLPRLVPLALRAMRQELRWDSPVFRHALRMSVVVGVSYGVGRALPLGHAYWAPLTAVMVMRPDFSQTYARGTARFAGTLVGVTVATGVMRIAEPGPYLCGVLAVVFAALMYLLMRTGYAASQVCVGGYVVFLLGMAGERWTQTVPERVVLTLVGGLLAMAAYAVFPAWETPRLRERLSERIETTGRYAAAVIAAYADPGDRRRRTELRQALLDGRAALAAWDQAVARADAEPVRHRGLSRRAIRQAEEALAAMGRVPTLMEAHLPGPDNPPPREAAEAAARFAAALREATSQAARDVRERRPPDFSAVRAAFETWRSVPTETSQDRVILRGADLLLDTLGELEAALRPKPRPRPRAGRGPGRRPRAARGDDRPA
jgi:uncharacterized membrane protein YccC